MLKKILLNEIQICMLYQSDFCKGFNSQCFLLTLIGNGMLKISKWDYSFKCLITCSLKLFVFLMTNLVSSVNCNLTFVKKKLAFSFGDLVFRPIWYFAVNKN